MKKSDPNRGDAVAAIIERAAAAKHRQQQLCEFAAERLRLFSEYLATPIRPARRAWTDAWQAVADAVAAGNTDAVVRGIAAADRAYAKLDGVVNAWLRSANDWHSKAGAYSAAFTSLIGYEKAEEFRDWQPGPKADLPRWLASRDEFSEWGSSIAQIGNFRGVLTALHDAHDMPREDAGKCLTLLKLVAAGPNPGQVRDFFAATDGYGWLAGQAAALTVIVAPWLPADEFRPVDLPAVRSQVTLSLYLMDVAKAVYGRGGQCDQFAEVYLTPTPAAERAPAKRLAPSWDSSSRTLTVCGKAKRVRTNGKSIAAVLDAFQAAGWTDRGVTVKGNASTANLG